MKMIVNLVILAIGAMYVINSGSVYASLEKLSVGIQYVMIVFLVWLLVTDYLKVLKKQFRERLNFKWKALKRKLRR